MRVFLPFLLLVPAALVAQRPQREALEAQARFEEIRKNHLSWVAPDNECQTRVGTMCYWPDSAAGAPPESPAIARARVELIEHLDSLHRLSPEDLRVTGLLVVYQTDALSSPSALGAPLPGTYLPALRTAQSCRPSGPECLLLHGYVLHEAGQYAQSRESYDSALAQMPDSTKSRWTDISVLLSDPRSYQSLSPVARDSFNLRFWATSRPSLQTSSNDRYTEHLSRRVWCSVMKGARNPYHVPWNKDLEALTLRYGIPRWYNRTTGAMSIVAHSGARDYSYSGGPEAYTAPYVKSVTPMKAHFFVFRRDTLALVYATSSSLPPNSVLSADTTVATAHHPLLAHLRPMALGLEAYDATRHVLSRARTWFTPHTGHSSVVLFDASHPASTLDEAMGWAIVTDTLPTRSLGIYWESYEDSVTVRLTVRPRAHGWFQHPASLTLSWLQSGLPHPLELDLDSLPKGAYDILLEAGNAPLTSQRIWLR